MSLPKMMLPLVVLALAFAFSGVSQTTQETNSNASGPSLVETTDFIVRHIDGRSFRWSIDKGHGEHFFYWETVKRQYTYAEASGCKLSWSYEDSYYAARIVESEPRRAATKSGSLVELTIDFGAVDWGAIKVERVASFKLVEDGGSDHTIINVPLMKPVKRKSTAYLSEFADGKKSEESVYAVYLRVEDMDLAERLKKAIVHASQLCNAKEPF